MSTLVKMPHCWKSRVMAHLSNRSKGNVELKESENIQFESIDKVHTMTLKNVTPGDAGLYSCKAHNPAGQTSCTARLKVARKYFVFNIVLFVNLEKILIY